MNPIFASILDVHKMANSALDRAESHLEQTRDIMEGVLDPEELNDLKDSLDRQNIVYINGVAYELASWGEPYSDGSRRATLRIYRPF